MKLWKPQFITAPLADGLRWTGGGGWRYEEKKDGRWCERTLDDSVIVGELMRDGRFWVFDTPVFNGADVCKQPLSARLEMLASLTLPAGWLPIPHGSGGEYLEAVLAAGGEGVVAKRLDAPYGRRWVRCKRVETHDCTVAEIHPEKQSVRLSQVDGARLLDCGWVGILSPEAFARLSVGDVVEIACHSRHASGKFREPRFLHPRPDKSPADCLV